MNYNINQLAETLNATEFVIELNTRGVEWFCEYADDLFNYNSGECIIEVGDVMYQFMDGELYDTVIYSM